MFNFVSLCWSLQGVCLPVTGVWSARAVGGGAPAPGPDVWRRQVGTAATDPQWQCASHAELYIWCTPEGTGYHPGTHIYLGG